MRSFPALLLVLLLLTGGALGQDGVPSRLIGGSTFTGTATGSDNRSRSVRISFVRDGEGVLAQFGSSAQVMAQISGGSVSFRFPYGGQNAEVSLTLADDGTLRGWILSPRQSGAGTVRETLFLRARTP